MEGKIYVTYFQIHLSSHDIMFFSLKVVFLPFGKSFYAILTEYSITTLSLITLYQTTLEKDNEIPARRVQSRVTRYSQNIISLSLQGNVNKQHTVLILFSFRKTLQFPSQCIWKAAK